MVTGTIGDAALGLDILKGGAVASALAGDRGATEMLISRYRVPQPRNALAQTVREYASAAMDVSDGLAGDLTKLCAASGVSALIEAARIPLSAAASGLLANGAVGIEALIAGGDDYEILAAVPADKVAAFHDQARAASIPVTEIDEIVEGRQPPQVIDANGKVLAFARGSFSHF